MKDIHFNAPRELYERFKDIFPYRGEPTAFFNRCMEEAVASQTPQEVYERVGKVVREVRGG